MSQHDKDVAFFVVWLLNRAADAWGRTASDVYRLLQRADIIDGYVIPCYEALHTLGAEALVEDLTIAAQKRGLSI